ncbi:MAG: DUF1553 domain-containing protein [Opitutae bacterium]|nr:DUF1553 domain-containing protein [Opitutae bacterium]
MQYFSVFVVLLIFCLKLSAINKAEFFESRIRPVLAENCYECHNSINKSKSELVLDFKNGMVKGGDRGPVLSLKKPKESLLLKVMRHEINNLKMPKGGPKLSDSVVRDFEQWISDNAYDPREKPPTAEQFAKETSWEMVREKRKLWWSFQPVRKVKASLAKNEHPVDQFLDKKIIAAGLKPNENGEALSILRRLSYALTGLPPSIEQQNRFTKTSAESIQKAVNEMSDEMLNSPHFGERWARHWMDWVRYADSHGSEGDPQIPNAFRYRNYLIRALNEDISFEQLVLEHIAGDLIEKPRINNELGINESAIGTAQLRFVLHGFAPTDALDEHVRFTDDQIDTVTKTFLGLTVSCARCHHHKFDAISQDDYYALFGILSNGRPAQKVIDDPSTINEFDNKLTSLKQEIKNEFVQSWMKIDIENELKNSTKKISPSDEALDFLMPWKKLNSLKDQEFSKEWQRLKKQVDESKNRFVSRRQNSNKIYWNLGLQETYTEWKKSGTGLNEHSSKPGQFSLNFKGEEIIHNIMPAGVYTDLLSTKQNGTLSSPRFKFEKGNLWIRVIGDKGTTVRYSVWNYPRRGTVYQKSSPEPTIEKWIRFKTDYWAGETGYLEVTTNRDHPVEAGNAERSWFGVTEAFHAPQDEPAPRDEVSEILSPLFTTSLPATNSQDLAILYVQVIKDAIKAWKNNSITDAQARILNSLIKQGILPNSQKEIPTCKNFVSEYRKIESLIKAPRLAPGLLDGVPFEQALFERGNHKKPAHKVPRRFLEAIDPTPYPNDSIGRLEFAKDLLRKDNPFTSRVMVNRIWHHLFGHGIVRTPDNFGRLGEKPSHPELLDFLATKFREDGWSIKSMIKFLVTTKAFRASSKPSAKAQQRDPKNLLLSHANLRRLEAEAIHDSMLLVSGRIKLDRVAEGNSEPANSVRRSVYRQVKRNSLDPFLSVFDAPVPASTKGRRDVTNVPAQSLTLMNDPLVIRAAREFANLHRNGNLKDKITVMFRNSLGRNPTQNEIKRSMDYLSVSYQESDKEKNILLGLQKQKLKLSQEISEIIDPVREKLIEDKKSSKGSMKKYSPDPILQWNFESGLKDQILGLKANLKNGATVENGRLILRNGGYAVTDNLPIEITEKTLSTWVQLDNLGQRAGGVITIQNTNGSVFDSIVFAEKEPRKWMSGSNGFSRTNPFPSAPPENLADNQLIHIAITYSPDGKITGYRNGKMYGEPYTTSLYKYQKNKSILTFGVRHLPASPQRMLHGSISQASVYNRALTQSEINAIFHPGSYVSLEEVEKSLTTEEMNLYTKLSTQRNSLEKRLRELEATVVADKPKLQDLALALFNMKEFIYLK